MRIVNQRHSVGTVVGFLVALLLSVCVPPYSVSGQTIDPLWPPDSDETGNPQPRPDDDSLNLHRPFPMACAIHAPPKNLAAALNQTQAYAGIFQVNNASTWADAILPSKDGYLVLADYAVQNDFALNLTEFSRDGHPLKSRNLSIMPSLANTARKTGDGGVLIGAYTDRNSPREGLLIRLNADLDLQWAKVFRSDGPASVEGVMETADGGIISLVQDNWRMAVVKLDAAGNETWKKAILPQAGATTHPGGAFDIYENTYRDAAGSKQCGGYLVYGVVQRPVSDWDLYLAALSCDGQTLLWQRIVSGPAWETNQPTGPNESFPRSTNIVVVEDRNGRESQDADILLAATTGSYGIDEAIMLVRFTVSGAKQLTAAPVFAQVKMLDGPDAERLIGPFGGPNLISLADGNLLLAGSIRQPISGESHALLVKMQPDLTILWQYKYSMQEMLSLYDGPSAVLAAGGGPAGLMLRLTPDGATGGPCVTRAKSDLSLVNVSPALISASYSLGDASLQIADTSFTTEETTASLLCPLYLFEPVLVSNR